jgi:hypothetical protein
LSVQHACSQEREEGRTKRGYLHSDISLLKGKAGVTLGKQAPRMTMKDRRGVSCVRTHRSSTFLKNLAPCGCGSPQPENRMKTVV